MPGPEGDDEVLAQMTDHHLAGQAQSGDARSFDELYQRHAATAARYAAVAGGRSDVVPDLVIEGFVRSLASFSRTSSGTDEQYLTVLLRAIRAAAFAAGGRRDFDASALAHLVPSDARSEVALHEFGGLPERQRSALWLIEVAGISPETAAGVLGVSDTDVVGLVRRADDQLADRREAAIAAVQGLGIALSPNHAVATSAALGYRARGGRSPAPVRSRIGAKLRLMAWLRPATTNVARSAAIAMLVTVILGAFLIHARRDTSASLRRSAAGPRSVDGQGLTAASGTSRRTRSLSETGPTAGRSPQPALTPDSTVTEPQTSAAGGASGPATVGSAAPATTGTTTAPSVPAGAPAPPGSTVLTPPVPLPPLATPVPAGPATIPLSLFGLTQSPPPPPNVPPTTTTRPTTTTSPATTTTSTTAPSTTTTSTTAPSTTTTTVAPTASQTSTPDTVGS